MNCLKLGVNIIMKMERNEARESSYMEAQLYNKTKQIEERYASGKVSEEEKLRYKNTFRTEVRVRNGKLNSNKQKKKSTWGGQPKILATYYDDESTTELYNKHILKIFGTNDFYRIDVAVKIIKNCVNLKDTMKQKLCDLVILVNKYGYTQAKNKLEKKNSQSTFRNHIKLIEKTGINVLTFDKVINGNKISKTYIKNFTSLSNATPELPPIINNVPKNPFESNVKKF